MSTVNAISPPSAEFPAPILGNFCQGDRKIKLINSINNLAIKTLAIASAAAGALLASSSSALASYTICSLALASFSITLLCLSILRIQNSRVSEILSSDSSSRHVKTHRAIFNRSSTLLHPDSNTSRFSIEGQNFQLSTAFLDDLPRTAPLKINGIQSPSDSELEELSEFRAAIDEQKLHLAKLNESFSTLDEREEQYHWTANQRQRKEASLYDRIRKTQEKIRHLEVEEEFLTQIKPSNIYQSVKSTPGLFESLSHVMQQGSIKPFCGSPQSDDEDWSDKGQFIILNFLRNNPEILSQKDNGLSPDFVTTHHESSPKWELTTSDDIIATARTKIGLINLLDPETPVNLKFETEAIYNLTQNTADFRLWLPESE